MSVLQTPLPPRLLLMKRDETYSFLPAAAAICGLNFNFSVREMSTACLPHTLAGTRPILNSFLAPNFI